MATPQQATVYRIDPKTGVKERRVVTVGDSQAFSGAGGGWILEGAPTVQTSTPRNIGRTSPWDDFLAKKENEAQMNFNEAERARLKREFDSSRPFSPVLPPIQSSISVQIPPVEPPSGNRTVDFSDIPSYAPGDQPQDNVQNLPPAPTLVPSAPPQTPPRTDPTKSFRDAMTALIKSGQGLGGDQDLENQRNQLIRLRYESVADLLPEEQRIMTPAQQRAIRSGNESAINEQIAGVNAALDSRVRAQKVQQDMIDSAQKILEAESKARGDEFKPITVKGHIVKYDPDTKTWKTVWSAPAGEDSDKNSIAQIVGADGKVHTVTLAEDKQTVLKDWGVKGDELTDNAKTELEIKLATRFEIEARPIIAAKRAALNIKASYEEAVKQGLLEESMNAPGQALITFFNKMTDPLSVVRESEYARATVGQSVWNKWAGTYDKLVSGGTGLSKAELASFYETSQVLLSSYNEQLVNVATKTKKIAEDRGLNLEHILNPDVLEQFKALEAKKKEQEPYGGEYNVPQIIKDAVGAKISPDEILKGLEQQKLWTRPKGMDIEPSAEVERLLKGGIPIASSVQIPKTSRLSFVNNNPGNLRFIGQPGAKLGKGGFARFSNPKAGYIALKSDIQAKQTGRSRTGLQPSSSLADLISKYAPPSENDTATYIRQIAGALGISPGTPIGQIDNERLSRAIAFKESGTRIS